MHYGARNYKQKKNHKLNFNENGKNSQQFATNFKNPVEFMDINLHF